MPIRLPLQRIAELTAALTATSEKQREEEAMADHAVHTAAALRARVAELNATRTQLAGLEASMKALIDALTVPPAAAPVTETQSRENSALSDGSHN